MSKEIVSGLMVTLHLGGNEFCMVWDNNCTKQMHFTRYCN